MSNPKISVIIRNRNESAYLKRVLKALSLQDLKPLEIILVDNESEDESVKIALEFGAKIVRIDKASFTYGRALNIGLQEAAGDICVLLSAHSLPLGLNFLTECVKPFSDERVAAVRCLYAGKGADQERWMNPELLNNPLDIGAVVSKGPVASGCAIRKKVWSEIPFNEEALSAEDKLWALEVLKKGHVIYSPCPAVYQYLKRYSAVKAIIRNNRDILEVYRNTGVKIGFAARRDYLINMSEAVFYKAPTAAINAVVGEALKTFFALSLPIQARRKRKSGSNI